MNAQLLHVKEENRYREENRRITIKENIARDNHTREMERLGGVHDENLKKHDIELKKLENSNNQAFKKLEMEQDNIKAQNERVMKKMEDEEAEKKRK